MSGLPSELTLVLCNRVNYSADLTLVRFIAVNYTFIEFYYKNCDNTVDLLRKSQQFFRVRFWEALKQFEWSKVNKLNFTGYLCCYITDTCHDCPNATFFSVSQTLFP